MTHAEIIHMPLAGAWLCSQCSTVSNDAHRCPSCASEQGLLNLSSVLNRDADDPDEYVGLIGARYISD